MSSEKDEKQPARRELRVFKQIQYVAQPEHCGSCNWWFADEESTDRPSGNGICDYSHQKSFKKYHLSRCSKWEPIRPTHLEYEDTVLIPWKDGATPQG